MGIVDPGQLRLIMTYMFPQCSWFSGVKHSVFQTSLNQRPWLKATVIWSIDFDAYKGRDYIVVSYLKETAYLPVVIPPINSRRRVSNDLDQSRGLTKRAPGYPISKIRFRIEFGHVTLLNYILGRKAWPQMIEFHYQVVVDYMSTFADMIPIQCTCNHNDTKKIPGDGTDWLLVIGEYL